MRIAFRAWHFYDQTMPTQKRRPAHANGPPRSSGGDSSASLLQQRSLELLSVATLPRVSLRSVRLHPHLFSKLIDKVDSSARPGDLVAVHTPQGELLGYGLYNPRAEIVIRMLTFGNAVPGPDFLDGRLSRAVELRRNVLRLDAVTDAYRVVHAEADGLSGLVVDRYGDVLSAEAFSLAMFQRSQAILAHL